MKRRRTLIIGTSLTLVLLVIFAVASSRMSRLPQGNYIAALSTAAAPTAAPTMMAQQELRYAADGLVDADFAGDTTVLADDVQRVVLKNASLTLVVADVDAKMAQISALAGEYGGWIVNAQVNRTGSGDDSRIAYAVITIRVDAERLDQALQMIRTAWIRSNRNRSTGRT
jgi:hypothetical protein